MLFSRDIYKLGSRCPFVFGRTEVQSAAGAQANGGRLFYTALFANAVDIAQLPKVSPFHAIMTRPSANENIFNYLNEIPLKGKNMSTVLKLAEEHNPFDISPITASNSADPIPFNYGVFPRTYSDASAPDSSFHLHVSNNSKNSADKSSKIAPHVGDGGALDVVELSPSPLATGMTTQVRVLGALALSSTAGKTNVVDWKIIAANVDDDRFASIGDVPESKISEIKEWLLLHDKIAAGVPRSKKTVAFGGRVFDASAAVAVVEAHRAAYESLRASKKTPPTNLWIPDKNSNPLLQVSN